MPRPTQPIVRTPSQAPIALTANDWLMIWRALTFAADKRVEAASVATSLDLANGLIYEAAQYEKLKQRIVEAEPWKT